MSARTTARITLRGAAINLALVSGSILLCAGALEGGLRLFWSGYYLKQARGSVQAHSTRGWANRPSIRADYGDPEFRTVVQHNSMGFRGPEVTVEKPAGRCRVLALGDSFTYGVGVENDETFSAQMELLDPRLEVLNTGVNGYGTSQELLLLVEEGLELSPDLVLVAFFWNDVANSYKRPVAAFTLDGKVLRYPRPPVASPESPAEPAPVRRRYLRRSYAYRFLSDRIKLVRYEVKNAFGLPVEDGELLRPEEIEPAWALLDALLVEIARLAQGQGAKVLIAIIPEQLQVQSDVRVIGLEASDYEVQERLTALGETRGIPTLDLLPDLNEAYERDGNPLYYRRDRHLRANGHRLVAERLIEEIRRLELVSCLSPDSEGVGSD